VDYRSVNTPDKDGRIIVPHSIVHSGMRWHIRAFCEKNQDYRDFTLTCFYGVPERVGQSEQTAEQDSVWNTLVNVCLMPDPRLSPEQQEIVANDYSMTNNRMVIQVRGSFVQYLLQMMRIDMNVIAADPRAQQVVIQNMDAVKQWLFR
jgi:predicted DNA-binding transcriptional regulator YafY